MKNNIFIATLSLIGLMSCASSEARTRKPLAQQAVGSGLEVSAAKVSAEPNSLAVAPLLPPSQDDVIQVALLLDVSSSMDGLIEQAKSELWAVVNTVSKARKNGSAPQLQIALYDYGKSSHSQSENYVRQVLSFTNDLDLLSEKLFSLNTNGGDEYCGAVIKSCLNDLTWQGGSTPYKTIFIAGNEPFNQGGVNYKTSCGNAAERSVSVNTIHCGEESTGISTFWKDGAKIGNGEYFWINSNKVQRYIATPYDDDIERLNAQLNQTYWGYGKKGKASKDNQMMQDNNAGTMNKAVLLERVKAKSASATYSKNAAEWDVNTRVQQDESYLDKAPAQELPQELQDKTVPERKVIVKENLAKRDSINREIGRLQQLREEFIVQQKRKDGAGSADKTLGEAIADAVRKQARAKGYSFMDN
jgi:hypothetical protein